MLEALPPSLAREIEDLKKRIKILEGSNKLLASAIKGGSLDVFNANGDLISRIGLFPSGTVGFLVLRPDSEHSIIEANWESGLVHPWLGAEWTQPNQATTVTSGSFVTAWESWVELLYGSNLRFWVYVTADAATTGEVRFVRAGVGAIGNTLTINASTSARYEFRIAHGLTVGSGPFAFNIEARRTSGAGNIYVYHPSPLMIGGDMSPVAGGWV